MSTAPGINGARRVQLTGCIRPETSTQLNIGDGGGQYDSSGGDGGLGNPQGSVCLGELVYGAVMIQRIVMLRRIPKGAKLLFRATTLIALVNVSRARMCVVSAALKLPGLKPGRFSV
ncbi:hypothetical protein FRC09_004898 [Ceratobasidium sp. 395]|nr:hypothetical protein FRC09_004898 [Ceratobasidium sp. 395]